MRRFQGDEQALQSVLSDAIAEARAWGHRRVGVQHVVSTLSRVDGPVGTLLRRHGAAADKVEALLEVVGGEPLGMFADRRALSVLGIDLGQVHRRASRLVGRDALDPAPSKHRVFPLGWKSAQRMCSQMSPPVGAELQDAYEASLRHALRVGKHHHTLEDLAMTMVDRDRGVSWLLNELGVSKVALLDDLRRLDLDRTA